MNSPKDFASEDLIHSTEQFPEELNRYVVFSIDRRRYALPVSTIARVIRSVEITPLPKAPDIVAGLINLNGQIVPVLNVRRRFRHPDREMELSDPMIVVRTKARTAAFLVTGVQGVMEAVAEDSIRLESILPGADYVQKAIRRDDGIILAPDLERFLSYEEEKQLAEAIEKKVSRKTHGKRAK